MQMLIRKYTHSFSSAFIYRQTPKIADYTTLHNHPWGDLAIGLSFILKARAVMWLDAGQFYSACTTNQITWGTDILWLNYTITTRQNHERVVKISHTRHKNPLTPVSEQVMHEERNFEKLFITFMYFTYISYRDDK